MGRRRHRSGARTGRSPWHVVAVVENVAFGTDHRLRKQVDSLLAHHYQVTVIGRRHELNAPYRDREGVAVLEYPAPPELGGPLGHVIEYVWSGTFTTMLLLRVRLRGRVDVLQLCQPPDVYFPMVGVARRTGTRVVVDQRDLMPELLRARYPSAPRRLVDFLHLLERRTQRAVDHTMTVNEFLQRRLVAAGGGDRVSVLWNGPVLSRVDAARRFSELRSENAHMVVWAGKMGVQDRADLVVDVAESMIVSGGRTDVRFVLLGDGECLEDLRDMVRRRGLEDWVTFTGWVPEQTVFEYLTAADAGIDTTLQQEVTPVKALEYMAFGLAFVAFDLRETRALANEAAVFALPGDVDDLSRALTDLLNDAARRQALGHVGRRRVEEQFSWEIQEAAYLGVVGPSSRLPMDEPVRD
jgi:glycosyltransferase involved in cell wall biosynthesis